MGYPGIVLVLLEATILLHQSNYVYTVNQKPSSAIPFNLPNQIFCQSCILHEEHLSAEPVNEMDSICRDYVSDLYHKRSYDGMIDKFMDDMKRLPISTNSILFYWALQAKISYEVLFDAAYTYRVLVEPEPLDYENCVTAFIDGNGFANYKQLVDFSPEQNETYNEGLEYEKLYTSTVVSIWGLATCNQTMNFHFVRT